MDPNAALKIIIDDGEDLGDALEGLTQWLKGGGFMPTVDREALLGL